MMLVHPSPLHYLVLFVLSSSLLVQVNVAVPCFLVLLLVVVASVDLLLALLLRLQLRLRLVVVEADDHPFDQSFLFLLSFDHHHLLPVLAIRCLNE